MPQPGRPARVLPLPVPGGTDSPLLRSGLTTAGMNHFQPPNLTQPGLVTNPSYHPLNPKPPVPPAVQPFQPQTDAALQAQAKTQADAQIGSLIDEINRSITSRSQSGMSAIMALTQALVGAMGKYGPAAGAAYGQAEKSVSATEDALANRLSGQGSQLANTLSASLAQAGQDTSGAQGLADIGAHAGNASLAKGSAALQALLSQGAAAQDYGAKLPGIGGLIGADQGRQLQSQLTQLLGDQVGQVRAQAPGIAQNALQSLYARQDQAQARDFQQQQSALAEQHWNQSQQQSASQFAASQKEHAREFGIGASLSGYKAQTSAQIAELKLGQQAKALQAKINYQNGVLANKSASLAQRQAAQQQLTIYRQQLVQLGKQRNQSALTGVGGTNPQSKAVVSATKAALPIVTKGVKPAWAGGQKPTIGSPRYYATLHQVEGQVSPILTAAGYSRSDVIKWTQQYMAPFYGQHPKKPNP